MNTRIKEIRKEKKLTQEKLGDIMGLSRDSIASIESSRVHPSPLFINHFCDKFQVNKDWLMTGSGEKYNDDDELLADILASITVNDSPKLKNIMKDISKLNDEYLDVIEKLVKGLIK